MILKHLNGNQNNFEKKLQLILNQRKFIQSKAYIVKKIIQGVKRNGDNLAVTAKDRVHTYLGGGVDLPVSNGIFIKPSLMIRKVKGLPTTADITGMVSWQNQFDIGLSIRTNSSMALMSMISLGMFDIGYAYETPTDNGLSQLNLRTHELVLRINLGESKQGDEEEPEADLEE